MNRKRLLKGVIGTHVHVGPSVITRELDAVNMLKEAGAAGYHGFFVKDHYFPSITGCRVVQRHLSSNSMEIFGSMCLNNAMGLLNPSAVDVAYGMGTKMIYFLTVSSKNHIDVRRGRFAGAGKISVLETSMAYMDENRRLNPVTVRTLEYMSERNMALGTDHGSAREADALVRKAVEVGMKKIPVNHPHFHIGVTYEQMYQWATLGAYTELNVCAFSEGPKMSPLSTTILEEMLREVPHDRMVLDSDMDQKGNGPPMEALCNLMCLMTERFRIAEDELEITVKKDPVIPMGSG